MSSTTIAPPTYVQPPAIQSHRYGLFSVANMVDPTGRWELGVEWEPLHPLRADTLAVECDVAEAHGWPIESRGGEDLATALPFAVIGSYSCGIASRDLDEGEARAREHLIGGEERAVEWALQTGTPGNEPNFQGAEDLTPGSGAVDVVDGFGILESYLGRVHHSVGVIHSPRKVAPEVSTRSGLLSRQGNRIETMLGTFVAFGGGYDVANVGPDGNAPADGQAWLYATARPQVRRSEVTVYPDRDHWLDLPTNDLVIVAMRAYVIGWDPVLAAVRVEAPEQPAA